jgi:hypothetical protein
MLEELTLLEAYVRSQQLPQRTQLVGLDRAARHVHPERAEKTVELHVLVEDAPERRRPAGVADVEREQLLLLARAASSRASGVASAARRRRLA